MPDTDMTSGISASIRPEQVEKAISGTPEAKLIIITSPTYEGVVSDIKAICGAAHRRGIPVLVDAAHGAHFGLSGYFPASPISCGADIVVTSLHKTLPALTQCALAHVSGSLIDDSRLASELAVFQTSSPSYVLLSSIDHCLRLLAGDNGRFFEAYAKNLGAFDRSIARLGKLKVLCHGADALNNHDGFFDFDPGKLVVSTRRTNLTGHDLKRLFRSRYRVEPEMAWSDYALAMTSICDSWDGLSLLIGALLDADRDALPVPCDDTAIRSPGLPRRHMTAAEAAGIKGAHMPLGQAAGMMSLEYIWAYPPGIPFVVPGEAIDSAMLDLFRQTTDAGTALKSTTGKMPRAVCCAPVPSTCL
jgi:arginine/lysine/ornithine decarboxylase